MYRYYDPKDHDSHLKKDPLRHDNDFKEVRIVYTVKAWMVPCTKKACKGNKDRQRIFDRIFICLVFNMAVDEAAPFY